MIRYFAVLLVIALSGCASSQSPSIGKDKIILEHPIQVSVVRIQKPAPQKDAVISQITQKLKSDRLLSDQYAVSYAEKQLALAFDAEILKTPPSNENTEDFIRNFLTESLADESGSYQALFQLNPNVGYGQANSSGRPERPYEFNPKVMYRFSPSFSQMSGRIKVNPDQSFEYLGVFNTGNFPAFAGQDFYTENFIRATFIVNGKFVPDDKSISLTISSADYAVRYKSIGWNGRKSRNEESDIKLARINEQALISRLQNLPNFAQLRTANITNAEWKGIDTLYSDIKQKLEIRYSKTNAAPFPKSERKYPVDFVTAKARLQRALGEFKYDEGQSAFTFSKTYRIPGKSSRGYEVDVDHKYRISLFPDKNETVVEFSGEYSYATDAFGGPDLHGDTEFNEKMNGYVQSISKLLK